jgi:transcription antitermination protein NusB
MSGAAAGKGSMARHTAARLAAVQALYQIEVTNDAPGTVVAEFSAHRLGKSQDGEAPTKASAALFGEIVHGTSARRADIDAMIGAALGPERSTDRLEIIIASILRAGAYELLARKDAPVRAVITEYMNLAHGFFAGNEPKLVNAVLDRIARTLRPGELGNERGQEAG